MFAFIFTYKVYIDILKWWCNL